MAWNDRISEAVCISPSGEEFRFTWEVLEKETPKKTTAFEFPDVDGTYIQDLGRSGHLFPLKVIFWGSDYDKTAKKFDSAIDEKGVWKLRLPFYGQFDAVPFGSVKRRDDLVKEANQVVYDITFWETIKIVFPIVNISVQNTIDDSLFAYEVNTSDNFGKSISLGTLSETLDMIASAKAAIRKIKRELTAIAKASESIERAFNAAFDILDDSIDILIGTPSLLAFQMISLSRLPARSASSILDKLEAYNNLLSTMINGPSNQFTAGNDSKTSNQFSINSLVASSVIAASIESTLDDNANYPTRTDVINAIEQLKSSFDNYINWSDENRNNLIQDLLPTREPGTNDLIDTGEGYQDLQSIYALAIGNLTNLVFSSLQERSIILDRDRTIIDFAAEYYGKVDDVLDFIITSNNLVGNEILELPKGREMLYYV